MALPNRTATMPPPPNTARSLKPGLFARTNAASLAVLLALALNLPQARAQNAEPIDTLHIDRAAPQPSVIEQPVARIERAADGRIIVFLDEIRTVSGYNVYRDSRCSDLIRIEHGGLVEGPPAAPRELRATIYSPGFIELFWSPGVHDSRIVAYRIHRDDVEIDTADQRSFLERGLEPGRTYRYSVTAIDDEGLESAPAYLDVQPMAIGVVPPRGEDDVAPAAPGAIRDRQYSPGVVEICWERSTDHKSIAGYEVSRDGALLLASTPLAFSYVREPDETSNSGNEWNLTSVQLIEEGGSTGDDASVVSDGLLMQAEDGSKLYRRN